MAMFPKVISPKVAVELGGDALGRSAGACRR